MHCSQLSLHSYMQENKTLHYIQRFLLFFSEDHAMTFVSIIWQFFFVERAINNYISNLTAIICYKFRKYIRAIITKVHSKLLKINLMKTLKQSSVTKKINDYNNDLSLRGILLSQSKWLIEDYRTVRLFN